jgi:3-hydroxyisobutyrate dehydrogenase
MPASSSPVVVIGLGSMGYGAAASLLRAGFVVHGVDINDEVLQRFTAEGGKAFRSPAEAARGARAVLVFVVNAEQTETVLFGADGAAAALASGALVCACATVPPPVAEQLGQRLAERGLLALDAPVSGGAARAMNGEMTVMASGSAAAFDAAEDVLAAIASKVYRLGDAPGAGSRVKMINQLLAGVHIAATCEALTLGMKSGLDPAVLHEVICDSAGASWMFANRGPHIIEGDYSPRSAVNIFVKDLGIVAQAGEDQGFPLPLTRTALDLFTEARDAGLGLQDDAAVAKIYARKGGLTLPGERPEDGS